MLSSAHEPSVYHLRFGGRPDNGIRFCGVSCQRPISRNHDCLYSRRNSW
jgi:hypothetical protein